MATYKGRGLVWHPVKCKILCDFNKGPYTTVDEEEKKIIESAGYVGDYEDEYVIIEDDPEELEEKEIRNKAKELGVKSWHVKSIENLIKEISEV